MCSRVTLNSLECWPTTALSTNTILYEYSQSSVGFHFTNQLNVTIILLERGYEETKFSSYVHFPNTYVS